LRATTELEPEQPIVRIVAENASAEEKQAYQDEVAAVRDIAADYVGRWIEAPQFAVEVPARPELKGEELAASQKRGQVLFYGAIANCVKCHGDSALGDGQTTDYDEWTKELIGDGKDVALIHDFENRGMLPPRTIKPRNLRQGVYRGGRRPVDLFWRLRNGIEGTPMPAVTLKPEGDPNAKGLTTDDIWDIVNYVQSLPYESISNPLDAAEAALQIEKQL
jgi:mono/diheme cytochrome c family protein